MSENILEQIIIKKKLELEILKKESPKEELLKVIENNNKKKHYVNFKEKIQNNINNNKISIIAEIKKASPFSRRNH
jgi:indole-3-glycerol phosphate synthase